MAAEAAAAAPAAASIAGLRVLAVDDSRAIRTFLLELLERRGAVVVEAASGTEALWRVEEGRFDIILLDLMLPDMDGMEILRTVRARDEESAIIVVTGAGGVQSATAAVRQGADGYIEKQYLVRDEGEADFFYAVEHALSHRRGISARRQLDRVKADFYSMVTHDLRNPAGNVLAALKLLLAGKAGDLAPPQRKLAETANRSAAKLFGLINDYLDFAKMEGGYLRIERRPTDLRDVVRASTELVAPDIELRRQTLDVSLPPEPLTGAVDPERLEQVLDNLLSNAVKYTPDGGRIAISLRREGDGAAELVVSDSGRGISPEQLPALFAKYHRVPGEATRGVAGTGLGLAIVKEIVAAHGGDVRAESEGVEGKGTTFVVRIPLAGA